MASYIIAIDANKQLTESSKYWFLQTEKMYRLLKLGLFNVMITVTFPETSANKSSEETHTHALRNGDTFPSYKEVIRGRYR